MDNSVKCFICEKNLISAKEVIVIKERGIATLRAISLKIGDRKHESLEGKTEIQVHTKCRMAYLLLKKDIPDSSNSSVSERSTRSIFSDFEYNKLCLFCQKDFNYNTRKKHVVRSDEIKEKLFDIAKQRNDSLGEQVIDLISRVNSLSEEKARYHLQCLNNFKKNPIDPSNIEDSPLEKSLKFIFDYIENNFECQFTLSELIKIMEYQPSAKTLLTHLKNHFGNEIAITGVGIKSVITYCGSGDLPVDDMWYMHCEQRKEDEHIRIIRTAAELIRKQIKFTQYKTKTYPSSISFLENAHADIPKYLDTFLEELMMFDVHKRKTKLEKEPEPTYTAEDPELQDANDDETTNEDDNETFTSFGVKKDYIAHSIISAIRPKSFISSLLLSTGLYINRKSGSKLIVNLLAKLGVCASYHSVALHELSAIKAEVSKIVKPCFTQYVYDNADHNPCTIDGKNTMHIMGGICCVAPRHAVCTSGEIPKLKRLPAATEVASIGSVELRDFPDQETSLKPLKYLDVTGFKFGDVVPGITTVYSTHIWASYIKVPKLPSIRGLFDKIAKIPTYQVSRIFCLPFIDENPSDFKTIYTALHYAAEHCKGTDRQTCFVTFDYPLYIKAKQILCNTKDENLQNVIPRLGGFHLLMSYLKAIGTIMEGSGIFELFCTVFAQNSVDKMLSCTAYSRAIRAHMLAMNAIGEIIAEFAESSENVDSHENIEYIKESRPLEVPPSFMSISRQIEEKKLTISNLFADLKNYPPTLDQVYDTEDAVALLNLFVSATTTLQRKSPTAELWLQYFNCIIVALRFIEAERLGYWNLHLSCIQQMLPIFHAAGHFNYCKGAQIYLQDMLNLENVMDPTEFITFTEKGLFTVRRTDKAWSGIWTDMTIEQTLMRVLKTGAQSATHGRSVADSVLTRFIQGMPYAYDIMDQLESFSNSRCASSDQHTDFRSARQKKDKEDVESFKNWLLEHGLFDNRPGKLMSLSTGLVGDSSVDCHKAVEKGLLSLSKMVGVDVESYKFSRKYCVKTLTKTTPVCIIDEEPVTVNTSLLFQRIVASMINNKDIVRTALVHELAPFPMCLFDDKGLMRESNKSELYKSLQSTAFVKPDPSEYNYVIDGGFLLHKVMWRKTGTFERTFEDYYAYICKHYSSNATIVFDGYNTDNLGVKSYERFRRVRNKLSPELKFTDTMPIPRNKDFFLSNIKNKSRFVEHLINYLQQKPSLAVFQAKEDADVLIVRKALDLAQDSYKKVIVVGTDVDLAALIIDLTPDDKYVAMWKPKIKKTPDVIYESDKNANLKKILLFAHAFTGCDTVSSIFNKGKHGLLHLIKKDSTLTADVEKFYKSESTVDNIKEAGERIMLKLFGAEIDSINECRIDRFSSNVTKSKTVNLATLPPTASATHQHSLRVYYQVQTWLGNFLNPENWGWQRTETLFLPIRTTEPLAPQAILKLVNCSCKTSNCQKTCSCRKAGMKCTRSCKGCKGESCTNATDLVEDIDDVEEDEEVDENNNEYEMIAGETNKNSSAYRQIMERIYGSDDSDSDDAEANDESREAAEEEQEQREAVQATGSQSERMTEKVSTSSVQNFDRPSCSAIPPLKKRRKRTI